MPQRLILPASIRESILLHMLEAAPNEGVGLVSTRSSDAGSVVTAVAFYPGANVAASPTRFAMDPHDVLNGVRAIRASGLDLGGIVHSHLFGPATPSEIDLSEAYYPDSLMIIVSFSQQPADLRAWHISKTNEQTVVSRVPIESR